MSICTFTHSPDSVHFPQDDTKYQMFKLKNQEFTVTVNVSQLDCGLNGALYFVQMDEVLNPLCFSHDFWCKKIQ